MLILSFVEMLGNKPYLVLNYDDMHNWDKDRYLLSKGIDLNLHKTQYIQQRIQEIGLDLHINAENFNKIPFMPQQDKNERHVQKIKYFKAFKAFLKENGLNELYFLKTTSSEKV